MLYIEEHTSQSGKAVQISFQRTRCHKINSHEINSHEINSFYVAKKKQT